MTATVTLAVLGAAVLHAVWNALVKGVDDHLTGFVVLMLSAGSLAFVAALFVPAPAARAAPYLAVSVVLHVAYQVFLLSSYRLGEFNQVYPIARGSAPLLVTLLAVPFADERLGPVRVFGVVLVGLGLVSLANLRAWSAAGRPPVLAFAFGTGVLIASYSVIDGLGVRRSGGSLGYACWLMAAEGVPIPLYALLRQRARVRAALPAAWRPAAIGGACSLAAYATVLWAQERGPLGAIAALRETSVIIAALIGAVVFHERFGRRRVIAAALVAAGVAVLNAA